MGRAQLLKRNYVQYQEKLHTLQFLLRQDSDVHFGHGPRILRYQVFLVSKIFLQKALMLRRKDVISKIAGYTYTLEKSELNRQLDFSN